MDVLPTEIGLHIYSLAWEPETVFVGLDHRPRKGPVTLHINQEARHETLRHYHRFSMDYSFHPLRKRHGYINPNLDVLFLYGPALHTANRLTPLDVLFRIEPAITQPLLRIILDTSSDPNYDFDLVLKNFPLDSILSVDFWVASTRTCSLASRSHLGNRDPAKTSTTTSRYRICRTPVKRPALVAWEETVFHPHKISHNSWCWKYSPAESRPLISMPPNVEEAINTKAASTWPEPVEGSELRIPCAVSYWDQVQPQHIIRKDDVLLFDAGPLPLETVGQAPESENEEEWSVLKVVDTDDVWEKELMSLAFGHLFNFSSESLVDDSIRRMNGLSIVHHWNRSDYPRVRNILHWLPDLESTWKRIPTHIQERAMVVGEVVHGVCGPGYMYGNNSAMQGD